MPPVRFELTTPGLQDQCSATELWRHMKLSKIYYTSIQLCHAFNFSFFLTLALPASLPISFSFSLSLLLLHLSLPGAFYQMPTSRWKKISFWKSNCYFKINWSNSCIKFNAPIWMELGSVHCFKAGVGGSIRQQPLKRFSWSERLRKLFFNNSS